MGDPRLHVLTSTKAFNWRWNLMVIGIFFVFVTVLNIGYTNSVQHQAERRNNETLRKGQQALCPLLIPILQVPASNPTIVAYHEKVAGVARTYGCTGVPDVPPTPVPLPRVASPSPSK